MHLQNATVVPSGQTICVSRAYGTMLGQNVTVVSSGINAQNAAMCTLELLNCASHIKDFIYTGTSGFSPAVSFQSFFFEEQHQSTMKCFSSCTNLGHRGQRAVISCRQHQEFAFLQVGGIINPTDCMEAAPAQTITRLGDICVTPFSNNWCFPLLPSSAMESH